MQQRFSEIMVDCDPDDEGAQAVDRAFRDFAASNMEREAETLAEIESSLRRIDAGRYGVCEACGEMIADARLRAIPWTRICVECAQRGAAPVLSRIASRSRVAI
jgi:RNA polymerase-binding transcription factor DksA